MKSFINILVLGAFLVVIAALLFPVFAQSKESAKRTQAIAERKQAEMARSLEGDSGFTPVSREEVQSLMKDRMVIRSANLTVRVDNVEKAEQAVNRIVERQGGYVTQAQSSDLASEYPSMTITMRVPVGKFAEILSGIEGLGVRLSKGISSEDVTEQVVDLEARLRTMGVQEETFRGLLRQSRDLNSIMSLEEKLTSIRSEIESLQAQRNSLAKQAAFSTITLTLEQAATGMAPAKDPNWLAESWGQATSAMGGLGRILAVIGIWVLVFSPVLVPLAFFGTRLSRLARKPA